MKFGKEFRTHLEGTLPEWRDKFLCYKPLKKLLKHFPNPTSVIFPTTGNQSIGVNDGVNPSRGSDGNRSRNMSLEEFQDWFVRLLNEELDKLNDFYVEKEEDFVIRFQELKEKIEGVENRRRSSGLQASESEFSEEMMEIRREFVTIHGEMVLLKNYSSLNFAGLVKILKKYDKRTGGLLRLPFTQLAAHQPFFTTEPLTRLVRDCEANLEVLFPLEEEVTESAATTTASIVPQLQIDPPPLTDITNTRAETAAAAASLVGGEEISDLYRSTLSAIRTIQGLRTSSTYNPLSFAAIFRDQDDQGSGAVTADNSPSTVNPSEPDPDHNSNPEDTAHQDDATSAP